MAGAIWDYLSVIPDPRVDRTKFAYSGDIYEQAVVKTVAGYFRGNSTHLFGVIRFGGQESTSEAAPAGTRVNPGPAPVGGHGQSAVVLPGHVSGRTGGNGLCLTLWTVPVKYPAGKSDWWGEMNHQPNES